MAPYQLRVVIEKAELDIKIAALQDFFKTMHYKTLPIYTQQPMTAQLDVMNQYSTILGTRIAQFKLDAEKV